MLGDTMNLSAGRAAREDAFDRMARHSDWPTAALFVARGIPFGWSGMGEDLRAALTAAGLREPHHPNAWGGLINTMLKLGVLADTGETGQMKKVSSHARRSAIYRKII
jgi:hypothetical protein